MAELKGASLDLGVASLPRSRRGRQRPRMGEVADQGDRAEDGYPSQDRVHQKSRFDTRDHPLGDPEADSPAVGVAALGSKYPDTVNVVSKSRGWPTATTLTFTSCTVKIFVVCSRS